MAGTELEGCRALLEVQKLDLELDDLAEQGANLPHKAQVAAIAQKAAEGTSMIGKLEAGIEQFDAQIKEADSSIASLKKKIDKEQSKLDAGEIDYRQVGALTTDIASHSKRIDDTEAKQIQLLEAREETKRRIGVVQKKIVELEGAKEQALGSYRQQMAVIAAKTHATTASRDEKRALVADDLIKHYDTLRDQRGGNVVGVFDGTRCSACSLALPTSFRENFERAGDSGTCRECRRVLVYLGEAKEETDE